MIITEEMKSELLRRVRFQTITGVLWMLFLVAVEVATTADVSLLSNMAIYLLISVIFVPFVWYLTEVRGNQP